MSWATGWERERERACVPVLLSFRPVCRRDDHDLSPGHDAVHQREQRRHDRGVDLVAGPAANGSEEGGADLDLDLDLDLNASGSLGVFPNVFHTHRSHLDGTSASSSSRKTIDGARRRACGEDGESEIGI